MFQPKCPKCNATITHVNMKEVTMKAPIGVPDRIGLALLCPNCEVLLSVSIDPIALKNDIVNEVAKRVR